MPCDICGQAILAPEGVCSDCSDRALDIGIAVLLERNNKKEKLKQAARYAIDRAFNNTCNALDKKYYASKAYAEYDNYLRAKDDERKKRSLALSKINKEAD